MSKVNRYWVPNNVLVDQSGWHPDDNEVVLAGEHDVALKAAQSELAALREELAIVNREKNDVAYRANETAEKLNSMTISKATMRNQLKQKLAQTQQRLTAAEQELDNERARFMKTVDQLATSLTAAEQRNAAFAELLERMLKDDDMPVHWFAQSIDNVLTKPTESGASE